LFDGPQKVHPPELVLSHELEAQLDPISEIGAIAGVEDDRTRFVHSGANTAPGQGRGKS
jgi:hypothetical protein